MRRILLSFLAVLFISGTVYAGATLSSKDADLGPCHDRPIGTITLKLGDGEEGDTPPRYNPTPPSEGEDIPPVIEDPPPPPPKFHGETVPHKFIFLIDCSGSMYGKMDYLRSDLTETVNDMEEDYEFDFIAYGTQFGNDPGTKKMFGALLPATEGNKKTANHWLNGPTCNPGAGNPDYYALKDTLLHPAYPKDVEKIFYLSDGGVPMKDKIIAEMPTWLSKYNDAELVCICYNGTTRDANFMERLASSTGGIYMYVETG